MKMMLMLVEESSYSLNSLSILEVNYTLQLLSLKRNPVMCSLKLSLLSVTFTWQFLPLFFSFLNFITKFGCFFVLWKLLLVVYVFW